MYELTQENNVEYTCTELFIGNIRGKEEINPDKKYRFKILINEKDKLIAIPEVYLDEKEEWKKASSGWELKDVMRSQALFLDFGQKKYIRPTNVVWDEIEDEFGNV
jgi:hypothetical protein